MKIKIKNHHLGVILQSIKIGNPEEYDEDQDYITVNRNYHGWDGAKDTYVSVELDSLSEKVKNLISEIDDIKVGRQYRRYIKITNTSDSIVVNKLSEFPSILRAYMQDSKSKILYKLDEDEIMYPYVIQHVKYEIGRRDYPPYCELKLRYNTYKGSEDRRIALYAIDIKKTCFEILLNNGYIKEEESLNIEYNASFERFIKYSHKLGKQFVAKNRGTVKVDRYSWNRQKINFELSDSNSLVIIDDFSEFEDCQNVKHTNSFISNYFEGITLRVPYHLDIPLFVLNSHEFCSTHIDNLEEYVYDPSVVDKLILPKETKELIDILITTDSDLMEDIVRGKTGGIIVAATGVPGVGKTLTAECYSEVIRRPLYKVQCSQLGLSVDDLEKNLKKVLNRAVKWKAILIIDEADVYIRKRGQDIHQNAIVGVFLRILEYYSGVLFMTSNRGEIIDDAIMSRVTAHIDYKLPNEIERVKIAQSLDPEAGTEIFYWFKDKVVSGRDIKSVLKLAKMISKDKGEKLSIKHLDKAFIYVPTHKE